ncbi:hypothetical protein EYF80_054017 [Liparis tanakae]|uniref:Uncharacterized protein n=1 Tax=Liparis tanakae TaxID=230148 RepID=A0A4Z2F4J4_9TELE|nr:hypothetical protein EYF80_054017 [Liparis tanakae]
MLPFIPLERMAKSVESAFRVWTKPPWGQLHNTSRVAERNKTENIKAALNVHRVPTIYFTLMKHESCLTTALEGSVELMKLVLLSHGGTVPLRSFPHRAARYSQSGSWKHPSADMSPL